jgi:hypothetical protein
MTAFPVERAGPNFQTVINYKHLSDLKEFKQLVETHQREVPWNNAALSERI